MSKKAPHIPEGFQDILESLSYDVLKAQPKDVLRFCVENLSGKLRSMMPENGEAQPGPSLSPNPEEPKETDDSKAQLDPSLSPNPEEPKKVDDSKAQPGPSLSPNPEEPKETDDSILVTQSEAGPPAASYARRGGVAAESWDPENEATHEKVVYPKSEEQKAALIESVKKILLFRCLDEDDRMEVVDAMFERKVSPGEDVITYGEPGDNFYIIESGTYDIYISADGEMKKVSQYVDKGSFGELALMYNTPRAATIRAVTDGTLWAMSRDTFRSIVLTKAFKKRKLYESLLESVDLLKDLSPYDRMSLADALHTRIVEAGEPVFLQGEVGQEMYFIESGAVSVKMKPSKEGAEEVELCQLGQNDYFGELALITKNPRAASVIATERTRLAVLEVDSFERILGPCKATLEQKQEEYAERRQQISTDAPAI